MPLGKSPKKIKSINHHSLIKIKTNKNLIQYQIDVIAKSFAEATIYFAVDDEKELICQFLNECQYSNLNFEIIDKKYNSLLDCVCDITDIVNNDWLVIMGDVIFNKCSLKAVSKSKETSFLVDNHNFFLKSKIGLWHNNGSIQHFSYTLPLKWSQICYLNKSFVEQIANNYKNNWTIHEVFNRVLEIEPAKVIQHHNAKVLEIVNPKDIKLARQVFGDI